MTGQHIGLVAFLCISVFSQTSMSLPDYLCAMSDTEMDSSVDGVAKQNLFMSHMKETLKNARGRFGRQKRQIISGSTRKWDATKPIYYVLRDADQIPPSKLAMIRLALDLWEQGTCLRFEENLNATGDFLEIYGYQDLCGSLIGRITDGSPQPIFLDCPLPGYMSQVIGLALGFYPLNNREDRDEYIQLLPHNADPQLVDELLLDKVGGEVAVTYGVPYDIGSILSATSLFLSTNDKPTILTRNPLLQGAMGSALFTGPTWYDRRQANIEFCSTACDLFRDFIIFPNPELPCQRGGYADPTDCMRCVCPDGFTGTLCNSIKTDGICGGEVTTPGLIESPGYGGEGFSRGNGCTWLLKAPEGKVVKLRFEGSFGLGCLNTSKTCYEWVEVRHSENLQNTGPRLCCYKTPEVVLTSDTNEMLVLLNRDPLVPEDSVGLPSGRTGFRAVFEFVDKEAVGYSDWGEWSDCGAPCGSCGTRSRTRTCTSGICPGPISETQTCNTFICSDQDADFRCGCDALPLFTQRLACKSRCRDRSPDDMCCQGYTSQGLRCVSVEEMTGYTPSPPNTPRPTQQPVVLPRLTQPPHAYRPPAPGSPGVYYPGRQQNPWGGTFG
ncbi:zinc metalloproteinase dpy-31-like [Lingula anatina]|uniref:Metalloendopeptidase n=1 Tax=Lingula anatina TaxID=7574 RepID=A0A1S3K5Y5_LINAN|nr:zinc metalloproteinase dpy-31-like [Lingula anatina]|eukprot:XP_013418048.1 zinc metalloproteinase dpy-31-like [Lingula anatina]